MRKSLETIKHMVDPTKEYKNLPDHLLPFYAYVKDSGHVLMAIPKVLLSKYPNSDLWELECAVPVKFILENEHYLYNEHLFIEVPYGDFGVEIDGQYEEW